MPREVLGNHGSGVSLRNARMLRVLDRVAAAFHEAGVPVLVMKGGALLLTVYRPGERPMDDLDLLVRPEHLPRACGVLERLKARPGRPLMTEDFCPRFYYEREFVLGSVDPVKIDLHVRPFRPLACAKQVPADALWDGAQEMSLGAASILVPSIEAMLVHLTVHAAFHGCSQRKWLRDVAMWIEAHRSAINWRRVLETVRVWRVSRAFRTGLVAAERECGAACPTGVIEELSDARTGWRERLVLWQAPRDAAHPVAHVLVNVLCAAGWRFKLAYLRAVVFPGRGHMRDRGAVEGRGTLAAHGARWWHAASSSVRAIGRRVLAHAHERRSGPPALDAWGVRFGGMGGK